jgi:transcriptional regulator with GAF, ATPase, and Fis domain
MLPVTSSTVPMNTHIQPGLPDSPTDSLTLEDAERNHVITVLKQTKWRVDGPHGAARILNVHPNTLRSRMKKLGIQRSEDKAS